MKQKLLILLSIFSLASHAQQLAFQDMVVYNDSPNSATSTSLEYGDIDNDGDLDLLVARIRISPSCDASVHIQENLGNGTFNNQIPIRVTALPCTANLNDAKFLDFNNDGNLDIIIAENTGNAFSDNTELLIYQGNGNGSFSNAISVDTFNTSIANLNVADFNGDGYDDIIRTSPVGPSPVIYYYENNGVGGYNNSAIMFNGNPNDAGFSDLDIVDLDNDGLIDIVASTLNVNVFNPVDRIIWLKGDGNGNITGSSQDLLVVNNPRPIKVKIADINNDGDFDLVYTSSGNSFNWSLGDNNLNFSTEQSISNIGSNSIPIRGLSSGDIDQDGFIDFIIGVSHWSTDRIDILNNNYGSSNPGFNLSNVSQLPDEPQIVKVVDIDNDTDLDILSQSETNVELLWHQTSITQSNGVDIYFSEYIEGSGTNKALEIANFTGGSVDLSNYSLRLGFNGNPFGTAIDFPTGAMIADSDVYVIANSGLSASCQPEQDFVSNPATNFNGNDAIGLFKNGVLIDIIGTEGNSSNFAQNVTLVRDPSVSEPTTTFDINQWITYTQDDCSRIGSHTQTLSISNFDNETLKFYPNPTNGVINIDNNSNIQEITISDLSGINHKVELDSNQIDISHLSSGIYFLNFTVNGNTLIKKIVKK
ncbi:FG-GAP-like repeat-containing protein [Nonlabens sp. MIC269]|uniref:FG-GAP-like repeat-containing protein n=1 Tax=Nonlabens sp. MIC269 TaxID=1476901 RepID=UPI00076173C4|nr:FG-GAP-like repeat-containing protein [Nonlabens sp. MIC269]